jgi:hypothetical protein
MRLEIIGAKVDLQIQSVSKRALQLSKHIYVYSENMLSVCNCHNMAIHTTFYLRQLRCNAISTDNSADIPPEVNK